jgi:hypothetical protein
MFLTLGIIVIKWLYMIVIDMEWNMMDTKGICLV